MPHRAAISGFLCAAAFGLILAAPPAAPAPAGTAGDLLAGVESFTLPNGLTVVMRREAAHPVVAVQMLYRVGARNETIGITGIAHYLEHMLFRGTEHFGLADITGVIERSGGEWHGYTTLDCTTFFEAAPKELLTTLLRLEAERMHAARMAPDEVDPERGAVFQEYRGYQLDPRSDLFDATTALLFQQHPYRNNTMGWESDLAGITHADLVDFYRRHYGPRNAVLAIQGDFDPPAARAAVEEAFGSIPAGGDDTTIRTVEPALQGPRRLTLLRPGGTPALQLSFLAPAPATPKEFAAFMVLDAILGDAAGLSFYRHSGDLGTGAAAPSGTPLGHLVDTGLAEEAGASLVPTLYPYHFSLYASGFEAAKSASVEAALFDALAEAADGVTAADVGAARRRIAAADALETDSYVEKAHELAYWTAIGGLDRRAAVRGAIDAVTADDVKEAAARLVPARAAVGLVLPVARGAAGASVPAVEERPKRAAPARHAAAGPAGGTKRAARLALTTLGLGGGSRAIVDARPADSTFVLKLAVAAPRGTTLTGSDELAHALLPIGASLDVASPGAGEAFAARDTLRVTVAGPASAFEETMGTLLARGGLKLNLAKGASAVDPASISSPMRRGLALLDRATASAAGASGSGSPAAALVSGPFAVLVGPFDPGAVKDRLAALVTGLRPQAAAPASRRGAPGTLAPGRETSSIPDIPQGALLLAIPGDADPAAQEAVAWILHHNYSGRLGVRAIAQLGLVYDMDSESVRRGAPLVWFGMGADPASLPKLEEAMLAELDRARGDIGSAGGGMTDEEIAAFKSYASGRLAVRRADPDQAARLWLDALLRGEDDGGPRRAADQAAKLTRKDVTAAAQRMLDPSRRHVVVIDRAPTASR